MFVAIYTTVAPRKSPSRKGFKTVKTAEEYILSQMCSDCKENYEKYISGRFLTKEEEMNWQWPCCACEWEVFSEDELSREQLEGIDNYGNG
jgi:hypothetical protein